MFLGDQLMYTSYFAPRGRERLYSLGKQLSERYLSPTDLLIGIVGDAGAGKSSVVKGMFPGLELTNDDDGVNVRPLPLLKNIDRDFFSAHTYHVDVRFELAFTQRYQLVDAVKKAIAHEKRVIVEHFDLLYPALGMNADILIGVGGEVILVKPTVFGPEPNELVDIVSKTLSYRKMAHTAEDLTTQILLREYNVPLPMGHRDVYRGFVMEYATPLEIDLAEVESKVIAIMRKDLPVCYKDEDHIQIGDDAWACTGPRTHVTSTGRVENFRLLPKCKYDRKSKTYLLIGLVGPESELLDGLAGLNNAVKF
jgi:hypothetical protein